MARGAQFSGRFATAFPADPQSDAWMGADPGMDDDAA
jgi:hypothetical protein